MALKRSGVRASSAPFHICTLKPGSKTRFILCFYLLCSLFLWQYAGISPLLAQNKQREPLFLPAVTILVIQHASSNQARVAVAYDSLLREAEVRADIQRLAAAMGTQVLDVHITQEPNRRGQIKTTATDFSLLSVPPLRGGEPQILPYLVGFQNRNRLEVVFSTGSYFNADSRAVSDTPQVLVRRFTDAQGGIRYEAEIRDAKGQVSVPVFANTLPFEGTLPKSVVREAKPHQRTSPALIMSLLLVAATFFAVAIAIYRRK